MFCVNGQNGIVSQNKNLLSARASFIEHRCFSRTFSSGVRTPEASYPITVPLWERVKSSPYTRFVPGSSWNQFIWRLARTPRLLSRLRQPATSWFVRTSFSVAGTSVPPRLKSANTLPMCSSTEWHVLYTHRVFPRLWSTTRLLPA